MIIIPIKPSYFDLYIVKQTTRLIYTYQKNHRNTDILICKI